jgi:hypothetical protein
MNRILLACCAALALSTAAHAEIGDAGRFAISAFTMPSPDGASSLSHHAVARFSVSVTVVADTPKAGSADSQAPAQLTAPRQSSPNSN